MKPPIFIYEPVDLNVFQSVEVAQSWLEPIDVEAGTYSAFDSEGKKLNLKVIKSKEAAGRWLFFFKKYYNESIFIEDSGEKSPEKLKEILLEFLSYPKFLKTQGVTVDFLKGCSLPDLVARTLPFTRKH
jgi:hypothetical protein